MMKKKEEKMDNKLPVKMSFSISSIQEGIEYWLQKQVLQSEVKIKSIYWSEREKEFMVEIDREDNKTE